MTKRPLVKVPRQARHGELILIRAKLRHPMETGWRKNAAGRTVPRKRINKFLCTLNGAEVFRAEFHAGVATDPYLAFYFKTVEAGEFTFQWFEDGGTIYTANAQMEII